VPEDYLNFRTFDLTATGNHLRGILDQLWAAPGKPRERLIYKDDILGKAHLASLQSYVVENSGLKFPPQIIAGDIFLFTVPQGHQVAKPSDVKAWNFLEQDKGGIYLIAIGLALQLRKLRRNKGSVQMIDPDGKVETLSGPQDFILFGRVIWWSGALR